MADSSKAKIQIETGLTLTNYEAMTDSGDHQVYTATENLWSGYSESETDYSPDVRPNGIVSGTNLLSTHASNDTVTITGFTAYSKGTLQTVTATTATFSRATTGGRSKIISITMASDGSIAVVKGTEHGSGTAFVETRGAAGGPPYIPAESVEIGQLRVTSSTAAALTASEILQVVGTHTERSDYPLWEINNIGDGYNAEEAAKINAYIEFDSVLPLSHTGDTTKGVYIKYYAPQFANLSRTVDFVPANYSHSANSEEYYDGAVVSKSSSLGQGSFTAFLTDGISDTILQQQDKVRTVKFFPNRNKAAYSLTQGTIGLSPTYPNSAQNKATVTITAEKPTATFLS